MFLDMSGTGEPHRGLGRLFVRKGTRWPHLFIRTTWSGDGMTPHAQEPAPVHSNRTGRERFLVRKSLTVSTLRD